jgi:hypothetical protein
MGGTVKGCAKCKWPFPETLLNPMFVGDGDGTGYTAPICGICALEIVNELHGTNLKKFVGAMAESTRKNAIAFREKHPEKNPNN